MQIETSTHEHGASGRVFSYQARYEVDDEAIHWSADVAQAGEATHHYAGSISMSAPGLARLAEEVVRDAVVRAIDSEVDRGSPTLVADMPAVSRR